MNTTRTLETVSRLLERKQAVPTQIIRDLLIECKAQVALNNALTKRAADLEAKPVTKEEEES
jgi:hypothetical protein